MDSNLAIEVVGYTASALIVLSITQKSILKLRLLGLIGALVFLTYSIAIGAYPIAVVNVIAAAVHGWYLRKLIRRKEEVFRILHVRPDSSYLLDFLDFYRDEIQGRFQPEFIYEPSEDQVTAFVLRDMVPAGLLIGEAKDDGTFEVKLDFVIPQYRDFKIGSYVYSSDSALLTGIAPTCVWAEASNRDHGRYLRRMGFSECPGAPGRYEIQLATPAAAAGAVA
ncbi:MAG: hypothetical protein OEU32_06950 [Acidimicrobiia bacterium]|nr:hypothetical protein [Acidimicrobiia bacterium]